MEAELRQMKGETRDAITGALGGAINVKMVR